MTVKVSALSKDGMRESERAGSLVCGRKSSNGTEYRERDPVALCRSDGRRVCRTVPLNMYTQEARKAAHPWTEFCDARARSFGRRSEGAVREESATQCDDISAAAAKSVRQGGPSKLAVRTHRSSSRRQGCSTHLSERRATTPRLRRSLGAAALARAKSGEQLIGTGGAQCPRSGLIRRRSSANPMRCILRVGGAPPGLNRVVRSFAVGQAGLENPHWRRGKRLLRLREYTASRG